MVYLDDINEYHNVHAVVRTWNENKEYGEEGLKFYLNDISPRT
jgi:hypothetical protein